MSKLTRRSFLQATAAASATIPLFTIAGTKASGKVIGANDTIRVGVAGINGRGLSHISELGGVKNVQITYLIDPDSNLYESRSALVKAKGGNDPTCLADIRKALDDKNVDAITVATCNHWHSLITVWACQAGKDVYVEKPISHNVFEGRQCVEAAKKYGCVIQHGTQQRSDAGRARQIAALQSGKYGKLLVSKGYCCKPRWSINFKKPEPAPATLDFNLWLGPAPEQEFHRNLVHYNWHWFWDTGNGDIGNQGVHELDVARWAIKGGTLPKSVWSLGGRFLPDGKDQGETANMQMAVYDYGDTLLLFEVRGLVGDKEKKYPQVVTNEFYTTDGVIRGDTFYPKKGDPVKVTGGEEAKVTPGGAFGSFIAAMRSRKPEDQNASAEVAHYSAALCHLANISYRLGEETPFDMQNRTLGDNAQVVECFDKLKDNMQGVGVNLTGAKYRLGRTLKLDVAAEKFIGDEEANQLLTRKYRAPFVVPEQV